MFVVGKHDGSLRLHLSHDMAWRWLMNTRQQNDTKIMVMRFTHRVAQKVEDGYPGEVILSRVEYDPNIWT
jgi:hypothetical protein